MQQRKFTMWLFAATFAICGLLVSTQAMAVLPTSCTIYEYSTCTINNQTQPCYIKYAPTTTIEIVDTATFPFPRFFETWSAEAAAFCGCLNDGTDPGCVASNYPCTVFKYKSTGDTSFYQHDVSTIPYCPEFPIQTIKGSLSNACTANVSNGTPFWSPNICGTQVLRMDGGKSDPFVSIRGKNVGTGVNTFTLLNNAGPDKPYACISTGDAVPPDQIDSSSGNIVIGGILGPGCEGTIAKKPTVFDPVISSVCMTNMVVKLDPLTKGDVLLKLDGKNITDVLICTSNDTSCTGCDTPASSYPSARFIDVTNNITIGVFEVVQGGGTMAETVGYFNFVEGVDPFTYPCPPKMCSVP